MAMVERDRGQVLPLLALVVLLGGLGAVASTRLTVLAVDRAVARTAADAAALAEAGAPGSGRAVAAANGGSAVVEVSPLRGGDVRVTVEHPSGLVASARARPGLGEGAAAGRGRLAPAMVAAIARAEQVLGRRLPITSGYRSPEEQARLWSRRGANPFPVAPPGSSMHERGLAIDVASSFAQTLAGVSSEVGLCRPYPRTDPVHFELCAPRFRGERGG